MQLDYITIRLAVSEIKAKVCDSQVREVVAQGPRGICIVLVNGKSLPLLFCAEAENSRMHALNSTPVRSSNREDHFQRTVRHHINGAIVEDFQQVDGERIVEIYFARKEFSGDVKRCKLVAELMGRHSNLVLVDEDGLIIISDHILGTQGKSSREVRAGKEYHSPSMQIRIPLRDYSKEELGKFLHDADQKINWGRLFLQNFAAVTPGFIKLMAEKSEISEKTPVSDLGDEGFDKLHAAMSFTVDQFNSNALFPPFDDLLDINEKDDFPINRALARFYEQSSTDNLHQRRRNQWYRTVEARIKSLDKLVKNLEKDLSKAKKSDEYRKQGDLIYAFLHMFKTGDREIEVDDITDPDSGNKIKLKLLTGKDAVASAREYHRKASRMSRGLKEITIRLKETNTKTDQYRELMEPSVEMLDADQKVFDKAIIDLKGGKTGKYTGKAKVQDKKSNQLPAKLKDENVHHYRSVEGHDIFVGGNDGANEALYRWGHPDDYWLHVKNIAGSHVLVPRRGEAIEYDTLVFAARLAVHHSRVKGATKVPVDYTLLKYVKKPPGGAQGYVIYSKEKNILADSLSERELKKRKV